MSGAVDEMSARNGRDARAAAIGFLVLLTLAVLWPAPVVWLNHATIDVPIAVNEDSFLGREAPSWDVVFWWIAGTYLLAIVHGRIETFGGSWRMLQNDLRRLSREIHDHWREYHWAGFAIAIGAAILAVAGVWIFLDVWLLGIFEGIQSENTRTFARLMNRLGGGLNPVLVVLWFLVAGIIYARPRWVELGLCMVAASAVGGIFVQTLKYAVGRSRPELWLGPFHHAWPTATSFPSGHTIGAFAIGSVIFLGVRNPWVRVLAIVLASGIGLARILAFRHWPSDVLASALIGSALGWICVRPLAERKG